MSNLFRWAVILLCTIFFPVLLGSCATLLNNTSEAVKFDSEPSGAKVYSNGKYLGTTPLKIWLDASKLHVIEFKKEGYEPRLYTLNTSVGGGWVVVDVLFGLVPVVVDAATGSWNSFDDTSVSVSLDKK